MRQPYTTVTKTREMNTEYDNSLPHQDRTHYSSQNHRPTRYANGVSQRSLFKNTNRTPWRRGHQTSPLRYTVREQSRVEGRSLPQTLLNAGLMRPGCSGLHPVKSSTPPWTESSIHLSGQPLPASEHPHGNRGLSVLSIQQVRLGSLHGNFR